MKWFGSPLLFHQAKAAPGKAFEKMGDLWEGAPDHGSEILDEGN
jgi:hypothetical protein